MAASSDFDAVNDQAWAGFRRRLADHVAAMQDNDVLVVETGVDAIAPGDGAEPYVQFLGVGGGLVRAEVSSNVWLRHARRLDAGGVSALVAQGWNAPLSDEVGLDENFFVDARVGDADRLAVMAVAALRDVFSVPHPTFVTAEGLERGPGSTAPTEPAAGGDDLPISVHPQDRDDLVAVVARTLTPVFGHEPRHDEDGDIPVTAGSAVVFVRVRDDMPVVQVFSQVVSGVTDTEAALFEVNRLNGQHHFVDFALVGDVVMAEVLIPALPFAPAHLRDMLDVMCSVADDVGPVLARRVGGEVWFGTEAAPAVAAETDARDNLGDLSDVGEVHPCMQVLLHLEVDRPGSLTPELAAGACDWDRDVVLALLDWNDAEERRWREARDDALADLDSDEADVCEMLRAAAAAHLRLLRGALRLVVERRSSRRRRASDDSGRRPHRRPEPDVSLPGLDLTAPEEPGLFESRPTWLDQEHS